MEPKETIWRSVISSCSYSLYPSILALSPIPDKWHWSFGLWLWLWIALLQHLPISLLPHCWQEYHPLRCHGSETKTKIEYDVIQTHHLDHSTRSGSGDYKDWFHRFCYQIKGGVNICMFREKSHSNRPLTGFLFGGQTFISNKLTTMSVGGKLSQYVPSPNDTM